MYRYEQTGGALNEYFYATLISACGAAQPIDKDGAVVVFWELVARGLKPHSVKRALERAVGIRRTAQLFAELPSVVSEGEPAPSRGQTPPGVDAVAAPETPKTCARFPRQVPEEEVSGHMVPGDRAQVSRSRYTVARSELKADAFPALGPCRGPRNNSCAGARGALCQQRHVIFNTSLYIWLLTCGASGLGAVESTSMKEQNLQAQSRFAAAAAGVEQPKTYKMRSTCSARGCLLGTQAKHANLFGTPQPQGASPETLCKTGMFVEDCGRTASRLLAAGLAFQWSVAQPGQK